MNDPRRPERFSPPLTGSEPTGPQGPWYPPTADPAYADQAPYGPSYGGYVPQWAPSVNDTRQLPAYWQQDAPPPGEPPSAASPPPPPGGPKSPRWLWIAAGAAVFLVVALVIALALANDAIKNQTAVPPLPPMPEPSSEFPTPAPSTRTSPPSRTRVPAPPLPSESQAPTETTGPVAMQDVVYTVNGEGRAISIMYIGTGDVIQTEFNVALPWSKEVTLSKSAVHPANVTIVNFGNNVTCSVTVGGVQVSQRVGVGLTICDARR